MTLELYPSAEQAMLTAENNYLTSQIEAYTKVELALQSFIDDTLLEGVAYTSAKDFASRTLVLAVRGLATLSKTIQEVNAQIAGCLSNYTWQASDYISETKLTAELEQLRTKCNELFYFEETTDAMWLYHSSLTRLASKLEDRIYQLHCYNNETAGLYSSNTTLSSLVAGIQGALSAAATIRFNSATGTFTAPGADWSFESKLSKLESLLSAEDKLILEYYQSLPPNLRAALSVHDFEATADGFIFCTKALDEVLVSMGLELNETDTLYYQSHFLFGIKNPNGGFEHSIMQIRVPGQEDKDFGIFIPFRSFDIKIFQSLSTRNLDGLNQTIKELYDIEIIDNPSYPLLDYFRDPNSMASYLIADFTIKHALKAAGITGEGTWNPSTMERVLNTDSNTAGALKKLQEQGIVNLEEGTVHIKDANNLTFNEKCAVLACITSNPDLYSYAAENQFHADFYYIGEEASSLNKIPEGPFASQPLPSYYNAFVDFAHYAGNALGVRGITSDAGVGESGNYTEFPYKTQYQGESSLISGPAAPDPSFSQALIETYYGQQHKIHSLNFEG